MIMGMARRPANIQVGELIILKVILIQKIRFYQYLFLNTYTHTRTSMLYDYVCVCLLSFLLFFATRILVYYLNKTSITEDMKYELIFVERCKKLSHK